MSAKAKVDAFANKIYNQIKNFNQLVNKPLLSWSSVEETKDYYGILAPLESYMNVSSGRLFDHVWDCIEVGDVVIGRVTSKLERGLSVCLLCFDAGKSQEIESLEISARCPRSEIPTVNNHEDPLSRFSINDLVRARIINAQKQDEYLIISFRSDSKCKHELKFGIISEDTLPIGYKRLCSGRNSYDKVLHFSTGFYNPNVISYLKNRLIPGNFKSLIKEVQNFSCPINELAPALRKRQSSKVASRSVAKGINFYRKGLMLEALQELNHALELDPSNVDALVARGALYANKRTFVKAIVDFEKALSLDQLNKNAKKYLVETLVERAKCIELEIEDIAQVKEASRLYKRALELDSDCSDAKAALGFLEKKEKKFTKKLHRDSSTDSVSSNENQSKNHKSGKTDTILKVRQLLEHDVGSSTKRKRRKSPKSSSSSTSSSSSGSISSSSSSSSSSCSSSSDSSPRLPAKRRRTSSSQKGRSLSERSKRSSRYSSSDYFSDNEKSKGISSNRRQKKSSLESRNNSLRKRSADHTNQKRPPDHKRSSNTRKSCDYSRSLQASSARHNYHCSTFKNPEFQFSDFNRRKSTADEYRDSKRFERRRSESSRSNNYEQNSCESNVSTISPGHHPNVPITKITKDNFSSILDQISKFEKRKSLK